MPPSRRRPAIRRKVEAPFVTDLYLCLESCLKDQALAGESRVSCRGEASR